MVRAFAWPALFLSLGLEKWFSERVRAALDESQAVAAAYLEEHRNTIRSSSPISSPASTPSAGVA